MYYEAGIKEAKDTMNKINQIVLYGSGDCPLFEERTTEIIGPMVQSILTIMNNQESFLKSEKKRLHSLLEDQHEYFKRAKHVHKVTRGKQDYEGETRNGIPHGVGLMHTKGEDWTNFGVWENSVRHGINTIQSDDESYTGIYNHGEFEFGSYERTYKHKSSHYIGEFHDWKYEGLGMTIDGGVSEIGEFSNGELNGFAVSGSEYYKYIGQFRNGEINGVVLYLNRVHICTGVWMDGINVESYGSGISTQRKTLLWSVKNNILLDCKITTQE